MSALLTRGPDWQSVRAHAGGTVVLFDELIARTHIAAEGAGFQGLVLQRTGQTQRHLLLWARQPERDSFVLHAPSLHGHLAILAGERNPLVHELDFSMQVPGVLRAAATTWALSGSGCLQAPRLEPAAILERAGASQADFVQWAFELLGRIEDAAA